jgi:hypothetical protein
LLDRYRPDGPESPLSKEWNCVANLLLGRKKMRNLRALAVMNGMTMCAHQYPEYVDPGYCRG